jgi:hypothetical protein
MASEDLRKMLPAEAKLFDGVNASYNSIMLRIVSNPNALVCCQFPGYLVQVRGVVFESEEGRVV